MRIWAQGSTTDRINKKGLSETTFKLSLRAIGDSQVKTMEKKAPVERELLQSVLRLEEFGMYLKEACERLVSWNLVSKKECQRMKLKDFKQGIIMTYVLRRPLLVLRGEWLQVMGSKGDKDTL